MSDVNEEVKEQVNQSAESQENAEETVETQAEEQPKSELEVAKEKIAELEAQVADLKNQMLYKAAEFENFRKRMNKERQEAFDYANTSLLQDLLENLDNFDRTIEAAATATDPATIAEGVKMINKSMMSMLENKYNLSAFGQAGEAFDPDIHEAIGRSPEEGVESETLKVVYLKGYKLKDRVIRHAKVMVSVPAE